MTELHVRIGRITVEQGAIGGPCPGVSADHLQAAIARAIAGAAPSQAGSAADAASAAIARAIAQAGVAG